MSKPMNPMKKGKAPWIGTHRGHVSGVMDWYRGHALDWSQCVQPYEGKYPYYTFKVGAHRPKPHKHLFAAGYIYAPYIPLYSTPSIMLP